ncbi:MAG: DNA translocase FtsK 4TM domain-containing protein [Desulfuromonadaceae bacterium]|nr:DNA translocase FtsK 4TM domain-containing protein [Desulfuromonas sp.]MDY0184540.1 DNA translocase FtsK 4TM domain-containing protein [Desulfuromonadaceae bacterium]
MEKTPDTTRLQRLRREIIALTWLTTGIYLLLCLVSFNNADPSFNNNLASEHVHNFGGIVGAHLADILYQGIGVPALLLPLVCFFLGWRLLRAHPIKLRAYKLASFAVFVLCCDGLLAIRLQNIHLNGEKIVEAGGAVGRLLHNFLSGYLNTAGSALILLAGCTISAMIMTRFSLTLFFAGISEQMAHRQEQRQTKKTLQRAEKEKNKSAELVINTPTPKSKTTERKKIKAKKPATEMEIQPQFDFIQNSGDYQMPPLSLLDYDGEVAPPVDREALMEMARVLENKLKDFNVNGEVVEVKPGPVVTMFEFAPAPGIKVNKIAGLSDDLSMALRATSIRIVAPIPGRGVVGIEIPNDSRETLYLKDIIGSDQFLRHGGRLPLALGKDIFGQPIVTDLTKMPHLLVAGSTGSGKSVSINTMILSLLYKATPEDVRLILVDPKMLELSIYEGVPHLLLPVVTDPKKASLALGWAVREMERRYKLMADKGVRNIDGYNKKLATERKDKERLARLEAVTAAQGDETDSLDAMGMDPSAVAFDAQLNQTSSTIEELEHEHLPHLVVIVDELADLMMVAGREIEEHIARLAQMARAAGIHLILATQRPSVDVITGLIKANFPTRISFKVFSRIDSRTILDSMGAETLLGMGDMLFLPPGTGSLQRVHGAFVSELEVQRVVEFLAKQAKPEYDSAILTPLPENDPDADNGDAEYDERWDEAVALVSQAQQASISMVQRRLRIGYNRAARIIEQMEKEGIVGPSDGTSKGREVLISTHE